jgi:hypothetical protein
MPYAAIVAVLAVVWLSRGTSLSAVESASEKMVEVGLRNQLFVDDYVVESMENITRRLGCVEKANGGKPIFTDGWFYGTVLFDNGKFKMWWRKPERQGFGYAESTDGLKFRKVADVNGINFAGDYTLSVTIDSHENDPAHRYKAAYDAPGMAAGIAHSADGIRWTPYNDGKPVTHRAADTYNQILWDEDARTYRLFTRTDFGTAGGAGEIRGNRSMVNPDVKANPTGWKTVRNWIFDRHGKRESDRRQIYAVSDWIYHGVHFGLMSVYEWPGDVSEGLTDLKKRHERDVMNYYIATSRDGDDWDLSWVYASKPIVPRGPDGTFDKDIILPASSIVTQNDRHWLYYAGANERHGTPDVRYPRRHAIGLATLRLDGFVALAARDEPGVIVTKPFRLKGERLLANVDARSGGFRVEILDAGGEPISGLSRADAERYEGVDELRLEPGWRTELLELKGQVIRLRFWLRNAKLYSFEFASSDHSEGL